MIKPFLFIKQRFRFFFHHFAHRHLTHAPHTLYPTPIYTSKYIDHNINSWFLNANFPPIISPSVYKPLPNISPSKRCVEKYKPRGLFSEFYGIMLAHILFCDFSHSCKMVISPTFCTSLAIPRTCFPAVWTITRNPGHFDAAISLGSGFIEVQLRMLSWGIYRFDNMADRLNFVFYRVFPIVVQSLYSGFLR